MAAEKKTATPTEYRVFRLIERPPANTGAASPGAPIPGNSWTVVGTVEAASASGAIRLVVAKFAEKDQAGTFVAVPARSWKPVTVQPQTTIRLELTEAKP